LIVLIINLQTINKHVGT